MHTFFLSLAGRLRRCKIIVLRPVPQFDKWTTNRSITKPSGYVIFFSVSSEMVLIGDCEDVSKICRKKSYSTFDSTSVHIVLSMYVCVCACIHWVAWPFTCLMVPLTCFSFLSVCEASLLPFIIILFLHVSSVYKSNKFFISFISFFFQSLLTSGLIDHGPLLANLWLWCMTVCPATMGVNIGSNYLWGVEVCLPSKANIFCPVVFLENVWKFCHLLQFY